MRDRRVDTNDREGSPLASPLGRRQFISGAAAMALLGFPLITIACRGDGATEPKAPGNEGNTTGTAPQPTDLVGVIEDNHLGSAHTAYITEAAIKLGGALVLDLTGYARHSHTLTLTADQVKQIAAKIKVSETSSFDFDRGGVNKHSHLVTFN